jgi:hypothetical protein
MGDKNQKPTVSEIAKLTKVVADGLGQVAAEITDLRIETRLRTMSDEDYKLLLDRYPSIKRSEIFLANEMVEAIRQDNIIFQKRIKELERLNAMLSDENLRLSKLVVKDG